MGNELENNLTLSLYEEMSKCVNAKYINYQKGEFITLFQESKNQFAVIKSGNVNLMKMDEQGNCNIIEKYQKKDIFSKIWHIYKENELFFLCEADTELIILDYMFFLKGCPIRCQKHQQLLEFFFKEIITYTTKLNEHLSLLQIKKLEDRLLAYLQLQKKNEDNAVKLSLTYKELADYLMVDRSALMRKITDLEKSGKIKKNGKQITLL